MADSYVRKTCYHPQNAAYELDDMPYLLTVDEARKILRCGKSKVYDLANFEEDFPAIRLRGEIRIHRDGLKKWMEKEARL